MSGWSNKRAGVAAGLGALLAFEVVGHGYTDKACINLAHHILPGYACNYP